jgi:hypothetical protein
VRVMAEAAEESEARSVVEALADVVAAEMA